MNENFFDNEFEDFTAAQTIPLTEYFEPKLMEDGSYIWVPGHIASTDEKNHLFDSHMLFPISPSAQYVIPSIRHPVLRKDILPQLSAGPGNFKVKKYVSGSYEQKLKQLCNVEAFSGCSIGKIVNEETKLVKLGRECTHNFAKIKGSAEFYSRLDEDLRFTIFQLGCVFLNVQIDLDKVMLDFTKCAQNITCFEHLETLTLTTIS